MQGAPASETLWAVSGVKSYPQDGGLMVPVLNKSGFPCRLSQPGVTPTCGKLAPKLRTLKKTSGMALSSCCFWKSSQVGTHTLVLYLNIQSVGQHLFEDDFIISYPLNFVRQEHVLLAKKIFSKNNLLGVIFLF